MDNVAYPRNPAGKPRLNSMRARLGWFIVALTTALILSPAHLLKNEYVSTAEAAEQAAAYESVFGFGRQSIGISAGHGLALPIGGTQTPELQDLQFFYLAPRWGIGISDPLGGRSWYRGSFELLIEGTFLYMFEPKSGIAGGVTPMIRYNFLTGTRFVPFLQAGGGLLALNFDLERQADGLNFTPQGGLGFHFFLSPATALTGEWRFHHISNAGRNERNPGINSSLLLVGLTFFIK